jgi:hypothetical protein
MIGPGLQDRLLDGRDTTFAQRRVFIVTLVRPRSLSSTGRHRCRCESSISRHNFNVLYNEDTSKPIWENKNLRYLLAINGLGLGFTARHLFRRCSGTSTSTDETKKKVKRV